MIENFILLDMRHNLLPKTQCHMPQSVLTLVIANYYAQERTPSCISQFGCHSSEVAQSRDQG